MVGEWAKMRVALEDHPKVLAMAQHLWTDPQFVSWWTGEQSNESVTARYESVTARVTARVTGLVTRRYVVASLLRLWGVTRQTASDGFLTLATLATLDEMTQTPGFGRAMAAVGWAVTQDDPVGVTLPNFTEWNASLSGRQAKTSAERQRDYRQRKAENAGRPAADNGQAGSVAPRCATRKRNVTSRVAPEKRRVEKREVLGDESPKNPSCSEPVGTGSEPPPTADETVLVYATVGDEPEWRLLRSKVREYQEAFPTLDVLGECRKALEWQRCNPTKRKTARGMPAYLFRWLSKAQNQGGSPPLDAVPAAREPDAARRARAAEENRKRVAAWEARKATPQGGLLAKAQGAGGNGVHA